MYYVDMMFSDQASQGRNIRPKLSNKSGVDNRIASVPKTDKIDFPKWYLSLFKETAKRRISFGHDDDGLKASVVKLLRDLKHAHLRPADPLIVEYV